MIETLKRYKFQIIILLIIIISIPLTLIQLSRQQETRSRAAGSPISLILNPLTSSQQLDTQFDVALTMNTGTNNVTALDMTITYSSSILTLVSFTPASTFSTIKNDSSESSEGGILRYVGVNLTSSPITGPAVSIGSLKFQGETAGTASVVFANIQATAQGQSGLLPIDTANTQNGSYIITTLASTPTPTRTPTPTIGSPTSTPPPTPTIPEGNTVFAATIGLDAIGTTGDNTTPSDSSGSNKNPKRPTRNIKVEVFDGGGNPVANKSGTIIYSAERGKFTGSIDMGTLASGNYIVKVKSDGYLKRLIPGIQTITLGQTYNVPPVNLVTGDINNDNAINILDYNILISCLSDPNQSTDNQGACNSNAQYSVLSDLEDNGVIDQLDYNLFLRELSVQNGD